MTAEEPEGLAHLSSARPHAMTAAMMATFFIAVFAASKRSRPANASGGCGGPAGARHAFALGANTTYLLFLALFSQF